MELTQEERDRRSLQARELHAAGKFGGPQPGSGRPRKKRVSEVIAEKVTDEAQTIYDKLMEVLRDGTHTNSIAAIKALLEIESKESDRSEREDAQIDNLHRDQLLLLVATQMKELSDRGLIPDLTGIIDGEAIELADEEPARVGEIPASTG